MFYKYDEEGNIIGYNDRVDPTIGVNFNLNYKFINFIQFNI